MHKVQFLIGKNQYLAGQGLIFLKKSPLIKYWDKYMYTVIGLVFKENFLWKYHRWLFLTFNYKYK